MKTKKEESNGKKQKNSKGFLNGVSSLGGGMIGGMVGSVINPVSTTKGSEPTSPISPEPVVTEAITDETEATEVVIDSTGELMGEIEPQPITEEEEYWEPLPNTESVGNEEVLVADNADTNSDNTHEDIDIVAAVEGVSAYQEESADESVGELETYINPEEVAETIIAVEEIDPNDIDGANPINIQDIGTVSTVTGDTYLAASYLDADNNNLLMIDVDHDGVFDIRVDAYGNALGEVPGGLSLSDAELMVQNEPDYLAQNSWDEIEDFNVDIQQDIIDL